MNHLTRRSFGLGAGAFGLAACADNRIAEAPKEEPRGGIGGTGIVGVLTEFGSLIVNGRRVEVDASTEIRGLLGPLSEDDLAIGQALSIEAAAEKGGLTARRVLVADPLIGRVERVSPETRSFEICGVRVNLGADAGGLPGGSDWVAVSGLWNGVEVVASRVSPSRPGVSAVSGDVRRDAASGVRIGTARIEVEGPGAAPEDGVFAIARGGYAEGVVKAEAFEIGRFTGAAGPLERLAVEGYLDPVPTAPFYRVSGLGHSFDADASLSAFVGERTLFEGPYKDAFAVETGLPLPRDAGARARLLRSLLKGGPAPETMRRARRP